VSYGTRSRREREEIPLKVLIVRIGAMGDVLHGLPAAAALRARLPNCEIGWAVEPKWSPLLVDETGSGPAVTRIHTVPTREWKRRPLSFKTLREVVTLRREIRQQEYDLCIDLQGAIKSALVGRMAAAKHYLGPQKPRERQARALYGIRVDIRSRHVIEQACEMAKAALSALVEDYQQVEALAPVKVELPVDATAERWCDRTLRELGVGEDGFVLLAPSAGWGAKQWQPWRYAKVAKHLTEAGHRVLVNAVADVDEAAINEITQAGDAVRVDSDIAQLVSLMRRAKLVLGGDTGPVHLAAALGRPVVALYGPTDPGRNGPFFVGAKVRVIRSPTSRVDYARYQQIEAGLATVTEDEVLASALQLLEVDSAERPEFKPQPDPEALVLEQVKDGFGTEAFASATTWKTSAFRTDMLQLELQRIEAEKAEAEEKAKAEAEKSQEPGAGKTDG